MGFQWDAEQTRGWLQSELDGRCDFIVENRGEESATVALGEVHALVRVMGGIFDDVDESELSEYVESRMGGADDL